LKSTETLEADQSGPDGRSLSPFLVQLFLKLRNFERQAERSQISDEVRGKWLFWADIFRDEVTCKIESDLLRCVLDRYIEKIRNRQPAVLSPTLLARYRGS
jgi:hypothetical protein